MTSPASHPRPPHPSAAPTVAVIGGGQLARMMAQAAVGLGVPLHLLAEGPDVSAAQVVPGALVGDYRDLETLRAAAEGCSVVTFDHEHVPTEHLHTLTDEGHACRPGPEALVHAQDKAVMRARLGQLGVPCPRNAVVDDLDAVDRFASAVGGFPVVLKTTRGGYDGKGVWVVRSRTRLRRPSRSRRPRAWTSWPRSSSSSGASSPRWSPGRPPARSRPTPSSSRSSRTGSAGGRRPRPRPRSGAGRRGAQIAMKVAAELGVTGILAVEMFETDDGRVLVNELAMRPHNTGHWSMDGAVTSQFENHLRAVLDLPLGSPEARAPWTVMVNILGGDHGAAVGEPLRRLPARVRARPTPQGPPLRQDREARTQGRPRHGLR